MGKLRFIKQNNGFTLIEVLIAITIIVSAFSVIFPVMYQSNIQTSKVNQALIDAQIKESIINEISVINVATNQSGAKKLSDKITYDWRAVPASSIIDVRDDTGQRVQLFTVQVKYKRNNREVTLSFDQMGWYD